MRFWEPPASRIFNQLFVFTATTKDFISSLSVFMMLLDSLSVKPTLGEHRRWSQSGHNKLVTLTS